MTTSQPAKTTHTFASNLVHRPSLLGTVALLFSIAAFVLLAMPEWRSYSPIAAVASILLAVVVMRRGNTTNVGALIGLNLGPFALFCWLLVFLLSRTIPL